MCAKPLVVSVEVRAELERVARSGSVSQRAARQARVLLSAVDGVANEETARRCGVTPNTVRAWRRGFEAGRVGVAGHRCRGAGAGAVAERRGGGGDRGGHAV